MFSGMETGVKAFARRVVIYRYSSSRGFEAYVTAKIFEKGLRAHEIPIIYCGGSCKKSRRIKIESGLEAIYPGAEYPTCKSRDGAGTEYEVFRSGQALCESPK